MNYNQKLYSTVACNCVGPQNGEPECPCMMPAYRQRKAEREAWEREQERMKTALEGK